MILVYDIFVSLYIKMEDCLLKLRDEVDETDDPLSAIDAERLITDFKQNLDKAYKRPYQMYPKARVRICNDFPDKIPLHFYAEKLVRMTSEQFHREKQAQRERVEERNARMTVMRYSFVLARVAWLKSNDLFIDNVTLLMLACGARRVEILETSEFEAAGVVMIRQKGLSKKTAECKINAITKPIIFMDTTEFMERFSMVRKFIKSNPMDTRNLVPSFDRRLEKLAKQLWPQIVNNGHHVGTHTCRAIYVSVAFRLYARPDESLMSFVSRVLGHENLSSVPHYLHTEVVMSSESPEKLLEADIQLSECPDAILPFKWKRLDGTEVEIMPIPKRYLDPADRKRLRANRVAELCKNGVEPSRMLLKRMHTQNSHKRNRDQSLEVTKFDSDDGFDPSSFFD